MRYNTVALLLLMLLFACKTGTQISNRNLAYIYNNEVVQLRADFTVFHKEKEFSTLYFKAYPSDLLYARNYTSGTFTAKIKISYKLLKEYNSKEVTDSASILKLDSTQEKSRSWIIDSVDFKTPEQRIYVLHVTVTDINRKSTSEYIINIDKSNNNSSQNFILRTTDMLPVFKKHVSSYDKFYLEVNSQDINKVYVKHYNKDFPIAIPAFSDQKEGKINIKHDSSFTMEIRNKLTPVMNFRRKGIYYIQNDPESKKGLSVFRFYNDFPEITDAGNMLYPLVYITTRNEYEKMMLSKDKKNSVDNFWLEIAGNPNRAREVIKKYYNRVREANIYFTSYMEGWKTDRGMIYIVFGKPNVVYKNEDTESWVYGSTLSSRSIFFNFYYVSNQFTDNDYELNRSSNFKNNWYMAVETWRR